MSGCYWEATMAWGAELMGVEGKKGLVTSWRAPKKKVGPSRGEIPSWPMVFVSGLCCIEARGKQRCVRRPRGCSGMRADELLRQMVEALLWGPTMSCQCSGSGAPFHPPLSP